MNWLTTNKLLLALIVLIIFLVMLVTPTPDYTLPLVLKGSVAVPAGMNITGTNVQVFNETSTLIGEAVVNQTGIFRIVTSSYRGGNYRVQASKGTAYTGVNVNVGEDYNNFGDADIGVLTLERI